MRAALLKALDRLVIEQAARSLSCALPGDLSPSGSVKQVLEAPDFFPSSTSSPTDLVCTGLQDFKFTSSIITHYPENNIVAGKFHRAGKDWRGKPVIILVHGWNGENAYFYLFPFLAKRLAARGINTAMLELPFHAHRRPRPPAAMRNFISSNLEATLLATRQSLADIRALQAWFAAQGCIRSGLWGFSLGAWLAGLIGCTSDSTELLVLTTPVCRMDQAIQQLPFCAPIREGVAHNSISLNGLSLESRRLRLRPENALLVASRYDVFAPIETVEDLWRIWGEPTLWRVPHGHISVLFSLPVMQRTIRWIVQHLGDGIGLPADGSPRGPA
jgi:pimeloyl-ACP methyl ester carboxylesterase